MRPSAAARERAPTGAGSSGVHVGMSNTSTLPSKLELEYRCGWSVSGWPTARGDGAHRAATASSGAIRVLEPATLSLLTDRRRHRPQGRKGGGPGATGRNPRDGEELPPKTSLPLEAGDVITITTPGGGGYGPPPPGR